MDRTRRFDLGRALAALGAVLLLVSLFLDWFGREGFGLTAWESFELVDLLLALAAVAAIALAFARLGLSDPRRLLVVLSALAFLVVLVQLLEPPPLARGGSLKAGAWLAFAGTFVMLLGAVLSLLNIAVSLDVAHDERVAAVDRRPDVPAAGGAGPAAAGSAPLRADEPTQALPPDPA